LAHPESFGDAYIVGGLLVDRAFLIARGTSHAEGSGWDKYVVLAVFGIDCDLSGGRPTAVDGRVWRLFNCDRLRCDFTYRGNDFAFSVQLAEVGFELRVEGYADAARANEVFGANRRLALDKFEEADPAIGPVLEGTLEALGRRLLRAHRAVMEAHEQEKEWTDPKSSGGHSKVLAEFFPGYTIDSPVALG